MRFLLIILSGLFAAIFIGNIFAADPGRVMFTWGEWLIQTSLGVFICAFVFTFIVCSYVFIVIMRLIKLPHDYNRWRDYKQQRSAAKYLNRGMLSMVEGDWSRAETAFRKGANHSKTPIVNYLGAARAAQLQGRVERRDHYLRLAHGYNENASPAVALTQAELQFNQKQYEQAYATLKILDAEKPDHEQVKLLLLDTTAELKQWHQVVELLHKFEKKGLLPGEEVTARQVAAYAGLLQEAGEGQNQARLKQLWQDIPAKLKQELYLLETYIKERLRFTDTSDCETLLRKAIKKSWEPELVRLFGLVKGKDPASQLNFMEKYLATHEHDAVWLLSLGRLSKTNLLWGKAKVYLEQSIAAQPHPETYQELAGLLEQQGDPVAASLYYREGLAIATTLPNRIETGHALQPLAKEAE